MRRRSRNFGRIRLGLKVPITFPLGPMPFRYERENVLHADDVLIHTRDLRNGRHFSGAVTHSGYLHDDRNRRCDLLTDSFIRQVDVRHRHHGFEPRTAHRA